MEVEVKGGMSLERLTRKSKSGKHTPVFEGITATVADYYKCVERLAEIENILGEIYDLENLKETLKEVDRSCRDMSNLRMMFGIDTGEEMSEYIRENGARMAELMEADKCGRCLVLNKETTLKKGDKVWYVDRENGEIESGTVFLAEYKDGYLDYFSVDFDCGDFDEFSGGAFGRCFFKSKEAAEAAIAKEEHHE